MTPIHLVLASANPGKVREFSMLAEQCSLTLVPQSELGVSPIDEPHATFVENALTKARHAAQFTGLAALADDSGLCVDALNGAPGVWSARFGGEPADDQRNNNELLCRLAGISERRAHYVCVLVAVRNAGDPEPLIVDARWDGEILQAARGNNGFGYDPLFYVRDLGVTAAEIDAEHKNRISHRGRALSALAIKLADWR